MQRPAKVLAFIEATFVNGAAKSLLNFCDTVAASPIRERLSISIATFVRGPQAGNEFVDAARARGIEVHVIPERFAFDPELVASVRRVVHAVQPDIIQTNNVKSHVLIAASGVRRNRCWVAFHHGYTATDLKVKVYNQFDRLSLPNSDRVITVCGPFRDQLVHIGVPEAKVRVLHNSVALSEPIDERQRCELRSRLGITSKDRVLLTIGRLSFEKGHADLIDALGLLKKQNPNIHWKLLVVGSGPEQANLEQKLRGYAMEQRVIFTGQQANVQQFYGIAEVMALPSHSEGSPHVVLEAMAANVPIVATRVGGIPEILTNMESALLTPARDPQALATAITQMLEAPETAAAYAKNAKQRLIWHFSHEAYLRNLLAIYQEILPPGVL